MEIRVLYKENSSDIIALDDYLRIEWNRLYENSGVVF